LAEAGVVKSKGEGRRLVQQGGIRIDGQAVNSPEALIEVATGDERVIQVGKRKFLRISAE